MGEVLVAHILTKKNLADLFNKVLYGQTHRFLVDWMLWDMFASNQMSKDPTGYGAANDWPLSLCGCGIVLSECRLPPCLPCCILPRL
jgi:hypothetical protein